MQPGHLSQLRGHLLFSESSEKCLAAGRQVKCSLSASQRHGRVNWEHSQDAVLHLLESCPAPSGSAAPGPHPVSSRAAPRPLGASGNRWHSALGSIRPQIPGPGFVVVVVLWGFFCRTTKNPFRFPNSEAAAKTRVERDALGKLGCFNIFAKVANSLCKSPGAQQK